ncbi:MAG TPA: WbuC family cupin fold metalloprotein [Candidatus Omnitrophota bacterium]|nr:WbuC family cupin fold metalloprotein [Candidatus Omnitrophota bacterium]HPS19500.1 WbuC family cupin fold metalloprotein [Candidatus Omnitrophota bacterium]
MECISSHKKNIIAIVIRSNEKSRGVKFFTPLDFSQQVGLLGHKKGAVVNPHVHKLVKRKVERTQEVLHMKKGRAAVYLYDETKKHIATRVLKAGDTIILASAGHGVKILEDSLILEIKQGPYAGFEDKEYIAKF